MASYVERVKNEKEVISNFALEGDMKKNLFNIMQNKQMSISKRAGTRINIVGYIACYASFQDDKDPTKFNEGMKVALLLDTGEWISGSGDALLNAIENYEIFFGKISEDNPMDCEVIEVQSGKNSMYKYINLKL